MFDLGNVLVDFDYGIAMQRIAARSDRSAGQLRQFLKETSLAVRFETGRITSEQFFAEVRGAIGFRGNLQEFSQYFSDIFTPNEPMVELHASLRKHGIPAYIFSNTNALQIGYIRGRFPFFSRFDGYVYSFEHGVMKPNHGLYEVVERVTGLRGPEIIYLDDLPENVAAGTARGWRSIRHESPDASRAALAAAGLPTADD